MAQKIITEFIDDIDGSEAERTFNFAVDGTTYEIDLSTTNIKEFHEAIAGFVESARKVKTTGSGRQTRATSSGVKAGKAQLRAIREWGRNNGFSVNDRGRISAQLQQAFDAAHTGS